jgi:glutamate synthase (ferredoxin)
VTNPPIDCIREELITASEVWLGSEGNLLRPQPGDCRRLELQGPILTNEEFAKVRRMNVPGLKVGVLSILFRATRGEKGLTKSMEELCLAARRMIEDEEVNVLILSDRGVKREFAAVPALLAVSGLHHYLIREGLRMRVSLALETGEAREVQHFALLIGYGCAVVNPYLAFETLESMIHEGMVPNVDSKLACKNYVKAATKGGRQSDVQDGHLRHPELPRGPGIRGGGATPGCHRRILHLDGFTHWRRRHGRHCAGSAPASPRCVPGTGDQRPHAADRWPVPVAR